MRKYLLGLAGFVLAFGILGISFFKSASIRYAYAAPTPPPSASTEPQTPVVEYLLPYPGRVLPDSPFWMLKAGRDAVWYKLSFNPLKRAEIALLFSDKRLLMSKSLFENKKPDIGFSTLSKGEKYLEIALLDENTARENGMDTSEFLTKLANASLKHREVLEEILILAPEDAKPGIITLKIYSKNAYKMSGEVLTSKGISVPKSPFIGD